MLLNMLLGFIVFLSSASMPFFMHFERPMLLNMLLGFIVFLPFVTSAMEVFCPSTVLFTSKVFALERPLYEALCRPSRFPGSALNVGQFLPLRRKALFFFTHSHNNSDATNGIFGAVAPLPLRCCQLNRSP